MDLKEQNKLLKEALAELCFLKKLKDTTGKDAKYYIRQPLAWKKANEVLDLCVGNIPDSENSKLPIPHVSQQREQLINFLTWHDSENLGCLPKGVENRVDEYLKLINCG
jgi:hypothetical protein